MAKQIGIIKLSGMIDDLVFYEHPEDGALVRAKGYKTGEQLAARESFKLTLDNASEFTHAIKCGQLLRQAFHPLLFPIADGKLSSRMNKVLLEIIQQDKVNNGGERVAYEGDLTQLAGFEFNQHLSLKDSLLAPFSIVEAPAENMIQVDIPSFVPQKVVQAAEYVKNARLISGAAIIDFKHMRYSRNYWTTEMIQLDKEPVDPIRFPFTNILAAGQVLFLALGLQHIVHIDELPKSDISKRKYWRVRKRRNEDKLTPYTGALSIVKVIVGDKRSSPPNEVEDMDGLGIA